VDIFRDLPKRRRIRHNVYGMISSVLIKGEVNILDGENLNPEPTQGGSYA